ncbi:hypothetical protein D3X40_10555 [Klebsiella quasipneumoniae]|nr:hypothetical protein BME54_22300 [Klebsiella quasipneumoniae]AZJ29395.1 hypothetical protein BME36_021940 [Klebsiella quasipneumoniae subsp. similipneumoniae]PAX10462.1 hypothetical protein BVX91_25440 [Klebsiella pneumoniae]OYM35512.1 hypothetical protein CI754_21640 [Klebsiella quasipneumoniae subsp. similipneumoniae]PIK03145.1 hypothetical protein CR533_25440 [Klebsiella pneumoniae]
MQIKNCDRYYDFPSAYPTFVALSAARSAPQLSPPPYPPPALLNNCCQITKWKQKGHFVRIL